MLRIFLNRRLLFIALIIVASNLIITGLIIFIIHKRTVITLRETLIDITERQKSLVTTLYEEGKTDCDIIQFIKVLRQKHYGIGQNGEFTIGRKSGDNINFLLTLKGPLQIKINNRMNDGLPMKLALMGKSGFTKGRNYKGIEVYAAYTFAEQLNWGIVAFIPVDEVNHPYKTAALIDIALAILMIIVAIFLFVQISNPILQSIVDSEEYYRQMFKNQHICMLLINPSDGKIADANPAACLFYGYDHQQLTNMNISEINNLPASLLKQKLNEAISGSKQNFVFNHKLADGNIRTVEVSSGKIGVKGETMLFSIIIDITERIKAQEILEKSEERWHSLFNNSPDAIAIYKAVNNGDDFEFTEFNQSAQKIDHLSYDDVAGKRISELYPSARELGFMDVFKTVWQTGKVIKMDTTLYEDNRLKGWRENIAYKLNTGEIVAIYNDVTERKKAEDEKRNLIEIIEFSLNEIYVFDAQTLKFIYVNKGARLNLGYTMEEMSCLTPVAIKPEFTHEIFVQHLKPLLDGDQERIIFQTIHKRKNGETYPVEVFLQLISIGRQSVFLAVINDISERLIKESVIKEKTEELEAQNEEYLQINEELSHVNSELQKAKEKAEESDRLKTAFIQNVSHEIRTPMNAIMVFSQLIMVNFNNKAKLEKFAQIIDRRCNDLLEIIDDILDISKIESGQISVNAEKCDLNVLFADLSTFFVEFQKRSEKHQIKLSFHLNCSKSEKVIITDKVKLKQIFINLIGNAFKFTESGKIECGCKPDQNNNLLFFVSDTGVGIPKDKHSFIFERFAQLRNSKTITIGGTGLGLSIVRGLVSILGGEIWLESEPGKGSTFYFSLPYKSALNEDPITEIIPDKKPVRFNDKTILIVDDDLYNLEYLKELLNETGINIICTSLGHDAIQLAISHSPDLVLMDIGLPDINGLDAAKIIKKQLPNLKVIAVTAYASQDDRQKSFNAGCTDYISKPLKQDLLISLINRHL